jgi:hypothetical protein
MVVGTPTGGHRMLGQSTSTPRRRGAKPGPRARPKSYGRGACSIAHEPSEGPQVSEQDNPAPDNWSELVILDARSMFEAILTIASLGTHSQRSTWSAPATEPWTA